MRPTRRRSRRRSGSIPALAGADLPARRREAAREPVEDFRIDFEDGYGNRPDDEEDGMSRSRRPRGGGRRMRGGTLPPFIGIRIKPLSEELSAAACARSTCSSTRAARRAPAARCRRTSSSRCRRSRRRSRSTALASALRRVRGLARRAAGRAALRADDRDDAVDLRGDGSVALPRLVAGRPRPVVAAHFGTYDYTAAAASPPRTSTCGTRRATSRST